MPNKPQRDIWFVTGCSSGIGKALAEALVARGKTVVITARNPDQVAEIAAQAPERTLALALDIANPDSVAAAVAAANARFGRIDVLVNNAGIGLSGAIEEATREEIEGVFRTNFFGTLEMIRAVLPQMRARRDGHIQTVSSMGGMRGAAGTGYYSATKFAVEGLHESLREEMTPLGIEVTLIEPGLIRTNFRTRSMHRAERLIEDYAPSAGTRRTQLSSYGPEAVAPEWLAEVWLTALESGKPAPMRLALGSDCLTRIRAKITSVTTDIAEWEAWSNAVNTGVLPTS